MPSVRRLQPPKPQAEPCLDVRSPWTILRPGRVRHYVAIMGERSIPASRVLEGSGIDAARLHDADYWILPRQVRAVIANVVKLSAASPVGFDMGLKTDLSALGILAGALLSCQQAEETLEVWSRFSEPLVGIISRLVVDSTDEELLLTVISRDPEPEIQQFCVEEILGLIKKLGQTEVGIAPMLSAVDIAYPRPSHFAQYRQILDCPIRFDADKTQVRVLRHWTRRPVISHDRELTELCLNRCTQIVARLISDSETRPIAQQIYELVLRNPRLVPDLEEAARQLKTSTRTLRRRLQNEGLSFQAVVRRGRIDLASDYLQTMSTNEVAELLGYSDERTFRRALKTWTGKAPSDFRQAC